MSISHKYTREEGPEAYVHSAQEEKPEIAKRKERIVEYMEEAVQLAPVRTAWDELKDHGSGHYKTGGVEPVDLYRAGGMFKDFALCSIIKYAFRSRREQALDAEVFTKNIDKIIDYAQKLKAACGSGPKLAGFGSAGLDPGFYPGKVLTKANDPYA